MGSRYSSAKNAFGFCDRCGFRSPLRDLRALIIKQKVVATHVCSACWEPDQPQLLVGSFPVDDPQAIRNARPDNTYYAAGVGSNGFPTDGSRVINWGWGPVGFVNPYNLTPNTLKISATVTSVAIS